MHLLSQERGEDRPAHHDCGGLRAVGGADNLWRSQDGRLVDRQRGQRQPGGACRGHLLRRHAFQRRRDQQRRRLHLLPHRVGGGFAVQDGLLPDPPHPHVRRLGRLQHALRLPVQPHGLRAGRLQLLRLPQVWHAAPDRVRRLHRRHRLHARLLVGLRRGLRLRERGHRGRLLLFRGHSRARGTRGVFHVGGQVGPGGSGPEGGRGGARRVAGVQRQRASHGAWRCPGSEPAHRTRGPRRCVTCGARAVLSGGVG
mmetsp:Transcript_16649/g.45301  ORF Transcript_16649/g.45301 Transcript_16649/m.45301 type:complete len:255 (-) Transcript_16649:202-966(-)